MTTKNRNTLKLILFIASVLYLVITTRFISFDGIIDKIIGFITIGYVIVYTISFLKSNRRN